MKFNNSKSFLKLIMILTILMNLCFSIKFNSKKTLLEALTERKTDESDKDKKPEEKPDKENKTDEKVDKDKKKEEKVDKEKTEADEKSSDKDKKEVDKLKEKESESEEFTLNSTRSIGVGFQNQNLSENQNTENTQFALQKSISKYEKTKLLEEIRNKDDYEDWLMISSRIFQDSNLYPQASKNSKHSGIKITSDWFRINDNDILAYKNTNINPNSKDESSNKKPDELNFWFRLKGKFLYYSTSEIDMSIIDTIDTQTITNVSNPVDMKLVNQKYAYCVNLQDINNMNYLICSYERVTITKFYCILTKVLGFTQQGDLCTPPDTNSDIKFRPQPKPEANPILIVEEIILPLPTRNCNDIWDYQQNGKNWECKCKDGIQQSPIDLPFIEYSRIKEISSLEFDLSPFKQIESKSEYDLIETDYHPTIEFYPIDNFSKQSTLDGALIENTNIKFMLRNGALKILHNKMGKMVTPLGEVFYAEEILFHTPSEHTIGGKKFDMEIQVIFYGQTKGDISKQAIVSYLFESTPGYYNAFIDDLDIQNLPDRESPTKELRKDLLLSKIFKTKDSGNESILSEITSKPFSFYMYQGSLTFPPCSENTVVYVNTEIFKLSPTIIQLFQEAILEKPKIDRFGNISSSNSVPFSNRSIQPLNGRRVMFYDHKKYCDEPKPEKIIKEGHFEKIAKDAVKYIYVKDSKPTGIPGSIVVSKEEALGSDMNIQPHY